MAICHDARKGRNTGSHWSKPVAPPLHSTSQFMRTFIKRVVWLGLVSVPVCSASSAETNRATEVFRYEQTLSVSGMPEIRGALPVGATRYKPVMYRAEERGWVVIADSFAAYKAAKVAGVSNRPPALAEGGEAASQDAPPVSFDLRAPPAGLGPALLRVQRPTPLVAAPAARPAGRSDPTAPDASASGSDTIFYYKSGDYARVCPALHRLAAKGLPLTQANLDSELGYPPGYPSQPHGHAASGSQDSSKPVSSAPSTSPVLGASQPEPTGRTLPQPAAPRQQTPIGGPGKVRIP